jgi:hypothetical protein
MDATDDDQPPVMILHPYSSLTPIRVPPGSRIVTADCEHRAWMSPQAQTYVATHTDIQTICQRCKPPDEQVMNVLRPKEWPS